MPDPANLGEVTVSCKDIPEVKKALELSIKLLKASRRVVNAADELNLDHSPKSLEFVNGLAALEDLLDEIEGEGSVNNVIKEIR